MFIKNNNEMYFYIDNENIIWSNVPKDNLELIGKFDSQEQARSILLKKFDNPKMVNDVLSRAYLIDVDSLDISWTSKPFELKQEENFFKNNLVERDDQ